MKQLICALFVLSIIPALSGAEDSSTGSGEAGVVMDASNGTIRPGSMFNVVTYASPRSVKLGDTGLREAGLKSGAVVHKSDEIRIFENRDVMNAAPLARIWLNEREGGAYWFISGGEGSASEFVIPAGAAVVVWTRAGTEIVNWTNVFN
jgi:hypothetical protein